MTRVRVGAHELIDGEWWLCVETTAEVVVCGRCGTWAVGHGRARTAVRDLAVRGRRTVLAMWSIAWATQRRSSG
ncbi:MAG: hypothetical protein M5U19_01190 [Microthrixaceae bacterium]|nr:hypothetical protein [Microthrixaceae bacterium]